MSTSCHDKKTDTEVLPLGSITRSKAKKFREVLFLTYASIPDSFDNVYALEHRLYNVLHADM